MVQAELLLFLSRKVKCEKSRVVDGLSVKPNHTHPYINIVDGEQVNPFRHVV